MNNTFLIVLVAIIAVLLLRPKSAAAAQEKVPNNAPATVPQPQGAQNMAPGDTFADVVNAMSRAVDSIANVADIFTQRN